MSSSSSVQWAELEQEPYDPEEFVERLAWRALGSTQNSSAAAAAGGTVTTTTTNPFDSEPEESSTAAAGDFDAQQLNDAFVQSIKDLSIMLEKQQKKCQSLEQKCREEELSSRKKIGILVEKNRKTAATYKSLDEKINSVATKVIHLGDQLESVNTPRSRDVEALKLMRHFEEFLCGEASLSSVFNDGSRLHEAADIILKLQLIAQELPAEKFSGALKRIESKYLEIQQKLIDEFIKSHRCNDLERMKHLAVILSQFKRYNACVDEFIGQIQTIQQPPGRAAAAAAAAPKDVFKDIVPLCHKSWKVISMVFPNPQQVMSKFVLNIYHNRIKMHIDSTLTDKKNTETYLTNLFQLYSQTTKLTGELSQFNVAAVGASSDAVFLSNQTKTIFKSYLESYINIESRFLNEKCTSYLQRYYESLGHQKVKHSTLLMGGTAASSVQDIKRDIRGFLASKANINIEMLSYGGETFLSEELAINLLQLTKNAFRRAQVLSSPKDMAGNAREILGIQVSYLLHEHIDYALEIGLHGIPLPECKTIPELYFFDVVRQTNTVIHLFEKQFNDSLLPLLASNPIQCSDCLAKKKAELDKLEFKIDAGLDRTLAAVAGWVKNILVTEQKKTDFNPPSEQAALAATSPACLRAVKFVNYQAERIRDCLDGKNIECVLLELGLRLHRVIYDHLQNFTYGHHGVMSVICDVQEYRKCVADFKVPAVNNLFDTLHAMCNLLFLPPENLRSATQADHLATLDRTILDNWIQLRADYKAKKLGTFL